jgi:hypothetical protein
MASYSWSLNNVSWTKESPPLPVVQGAFDANNPGLWALHCHLLYHLAAGMFTTVLYV